jgi:hypothetical protein
MFSYFSKFFSPEEQKILSDKYIIHINEYTYDIPSEENFKELLNNFMVHILNNKYGNTSDNLNKYTINFINNEKSELIASTINREYVVELLESINNITLNNKLTSLTVSS